MANLLYNGVSLPAKPPAAAGYGVEVIVNVLPAGQSIYGGSAYLFVQGSRLLWQNGKCYVGGIYAVYRLSGDKWVWHYGSGTVSTQDIVAANYFEALWTNTDIPNANGSGIYLAATEPVDPDAPVEPDEPEEPPVEPEEPETPTVTTAQLRRAFSNGFILGMQVRGMLKKKVVEEPDEPVTADFYLYGASSESGNVAVADGDGYVLYNGAVLPKLPEWDKSIRKYAAIEFGMTVGQYSATLIVAESYTVGTGVYGETVYFANALQFRTDFVSEPAEITKWNTEPREYETLGLPFIYTTWANIDLVCATNELKPAGTVYIPATEPIPLISNVPIRYEGDIPIYQKKE